MKIELNQAQWNLVDELFSTTSYRGICRALGIDERFKSNVIRLLKKNGYVKFTGRDVNHNFFREPSHEMFYVLGFMFADGNVFSDATHHDVLIRLALKDKDHLEKIRCVLKMKKPLRDELERWADLGYGLKNYPSTVLSVSSKQIVEDLISFGCVPNKSYDLVGYYNIPDVYFNSFMLGWVDGDGCISVTRGLRSFSIAIEVNPCVSNQIRDRLERLSGSRGTIGSPSDKKNHVIRFSCANAVSLGDYLYKDKGIYLKRKYTNYERYKEKRNL